MEILGLTNALESHFGLLEDMFCGGAPTLSAASLLELFRVQYSTRGSSRRALEEAAVGYWRDWLIDVEGEFILDYKKRCFFLKIFRIYVSTSLYSSQIHCYIKLT